MPVGAPSFAEALRMGAEIFHTLKAALKASRPQHQCRRRGRLRAQPASRPKPRSISSCRRSRRPATRPATTCCSRSIAPRPNFSRTAPIVTKARARRARKEQQVEYLAELVVALSDRLDRRRHGRGRFRRLEASDQENRRQVPARRRRSVRHQRHAAGRGHRQGASAIRSWSRSTRSARSPRRWPRSRWRTRPATPR